MSRIDIGEIQTFAHQLHTANEVGIKSIKDIKTAVENYTEDGSLKGKAIDASKNYYQMTYFPLCDAIIEAMNESEERLAQYIADFHAQVDGSADARIDADGLYELGKMIDRIEAKKEALAQRMNTGTEGQMQSYRSQLSIAYKQENILEKYLAFEQSHGGFFDNLTDLVRGIQQTIRELQSNIQFNSKTGTYDMSKLNFTTVSRMQNVLEKALNDNEKTFNFDEYQKTYRGQMWVLMKNGIVDVEATNAYNSAVLGGEMPHESNEAQEEAELLQAVIQSVKEGTDPVTGQEISKAQGFSIISGLFFRYTVGGYKGKKFKVSKNILDGIKKSRNSKSILTSEMEAKILEGQRKGTTNGINGGHSSNINNANPNFATETVKVNQDGTKVIKFTKQFPDGNISKIKTSTIFPEDWSDKDIIDSILKVSNSNAIGQRNIDGLTLHRGKINGVEIDVIKKGNEIISGYPVGGKPTPGFETIK
ncbi:T7SS effector LXG polymorphic toxin [Listeria monocytogenes]|uniref:T7SS effector LXG polymorphic toxin n=1 Tax=Listeria monocytogenes TaxID=1639 RepID=UPI0013071CB6|nr:T7SS effector LXG polymorphic toxin [Listeria monocytogenes]ECJ9735735.1 transposase [Listeria monocytogenes]EFS0593401.1 transposase [Listeria monocytogenes]EFU9760712.1 transposase [Listeria monocytogenes]ELN6994865.1 EndoU domain-containing protein [Listeria monocytogenes]MCD2241656.1 EndoU domain-containing protein [Listeria monocytogenes]